LWAALFFVNQGFSLSSSLSGPWLHWPELFPSAKTQYARPQHGAILLSTSPKKSKKFQVNKDIYVE
jgi:hypothetical protein